MVVIFRFTIYYEQTKYFYQNNAMNWKNKIKVKDFLIGKKYSFIFGKCKLSSAVFKIPYFVFVFVSRGVNRKCKRYLITKKPFKFISILLLLPRVSKYTLLSLCFGHIRDPRWIVFSLTTYQKCKYHSE